MAQRGARAARAWEEDAGFLPGVVVTPPFPVAMAAQHQERARVDRTVSLWRQSPVPTKSRPHEAATQGNSQPPAQGSTQQLCFFHEWRSSDTLCSIRV